jgi:hypothetical protein
VAYVLVVPLFVRLGACLGVLLQNRVHISAGVLEELVVGVENDEGDVTVAEHTQLHGFLHQPILALGKCDLRPRVSVSRSRIDQPRLRASAHLTVPLVRNPLDSDLLATHCGGSEQS